MIKALAAVVVIAAFLYVADQQFSHGMYTRQFERMVSQIRHSTGI